jgi:4-amino-4-deoxy-L-arabinose transferase-like glycosyltransferase
MKIRASIVALVLLLAITGLATALRLYALDKQSLWYDEAFSVYLARMDLGEIADRTAADIQPPLYYFLLHGWIRLFGDGEPALRSLSVLFGVLAVPLIYGVGRQLFRRRPAGLLAALLLAVSPLHIWYGQETRMYTLLILLCLLSSYLLLLLAARRDGENRGGVVGDVGLWLAYTLTSIAALYTHYFALFILAFQAIYLLMVWGGQGFRPRRLAVGGLISGVAIGLAYLPWLPHLLTRYGADTSYWPGQLNLGQVLVDIALSFAGGETLPEQPGVLLAIVTGLIALLACLALLRPGLLHSSLTVIASEAKQSPSGESEIASVASLLRNDDFSAALG